MMHLSGIFRDLFFRSVILAGILVFVTSCVDDSVGNSELSTIAEIEQTQVKFIGMWLGEGKREKLLLDFIRKYEFENQHIDVVMEFPENIFMTEEKYMSNQDFVAEIIKEENPEWDIVRLNNQYAEIGAVTGNENWAKENLVDFSVYPEFRSNTMSELLSQDVKDKWGGIIPGPFIEGQYYALWSNKLVEDKLGINVKQNGMTVNDLLTYFEAVYKYNQNNPDDIIIPIHDGSDWSTIFVMIFHMYASELVNADLIFNTEVTHQKLAAWNKTLKILEQLASYKAADNTANLSWYQCSMDLLDGKALFYVNGSWMYNIWDKENPEQTKNCIPNELPVFNNFAQYPGSYLSMWGVLKKSPNKKAAVDFLLAMSKPEVGDMWVQYTKCPTGIKNRISAGAIGADQFEAFAQYLQTTYGNSLYHYSEQMNKYIMGEEWWLSNYYYDVLNGAMEADEAMARMKLSLGN